MSANLRDSRPLALAAISIFLISITIAGCSKPDKLPLSPSYPTLGKSRATRHGISSLLVSTETWIDPNLGSGDDGAVVRPTGYTLYDDQGVEMKHVRNYIGALDSVPQTVELDTGRYLIQLDKPGNHPAIFWVVVEPGRLTEVSTGKK
jgi:hypothetical protein